MTRILFATAEYVPLASVGGLGAASAGLVRELRALGVEVDVVLPDYTGLALTSEHVRALDVPDWASPASVRSGVHEVAGHVHLVDVPGIRRPNPYTDADGRGWTDNDRRFIGFSFAVAALARNLRPDVLHVNDWHTTAALAARGPTAPSVLSIHNLAYQGEVGAAWLERLAPRAAAYAWDRSVNLLAGGIRLADAIVVVSPHYREEVLRPEHGHGLDSLLSERSAVLTGIRNGIDTDAWNPATDPHLACPYDHPDAAARDTNRAAVCADVGLVPDGGGPDGGGPLVVSVTRLAEQKGIDLLLPALDDLPHLPARLALLGSGDATLASELHTAARRLPGVFAFVEGYDERLAHRLFGGGDLLVMPSRFEPCGLTQMQAMRYGTLPVATDVGGLHDTIVDLDAEPERGTGWLAPEPTPGAVIEALRRATRGWQRVDDRTAAQDRAMRTDWSWREPARAHADLYERLRRRA
jgi:starch synthase